MSSRKQKGSRSCRAPGWRCGPCSSRRARPSAGYGAGRSLAIKASCSPPGPNRAVRAPGKSDDQVTPPIKDGGVFGDGQTRNTSRSGPPKRRCTPSWVVGKSVARRTEDIDGAASGHREIARGIPGASAGARGPCQSAGARLDLDHDGIHGVAGLVNGLMGQVREVRRVRMARELDVASAI